MGSLKVHLDCLPVAEAEVLDPCFLDRVQDLLTSGVSDLVFRDSEELSNHSIAAGFVNEEDKVVKLAIVLHVPAIHLHT